MEGRTKAAAPEASNGISPSLAVAAPAGGILIRAQVVAAETPRQQNLEASRESPSFTVVHPGPGDHDSHPSSARRPSASDVPSRAPASTPHLARDDRAPQDFTMLQKSLEQFRGDQTKRLPIHPREKALLWLLCIHLCALPWAIGDMRLWGQIPSGIL